MAEIRLLPCHRDPSLLFPTLCDLEISRTLSEFVPVAKSCFGNKKKLFATGINIRRIAHAISQTSIGFRNALKIGYGWPIFEPNKDIPFTFFFGVDLPLLFARSTFRLKYMGGEDSCRSNYLLSSTARTFFAKFAVENGF